MNEFTEFVETYVPRGLWFVILIFGAMLVLPCAAIGFFVLPPKTFDRWFRS
jgi:hypothetical protein